MNDFIFQNTTKVYFGKDQMQYLSGEIGRYGNKMLLVYGGGSIKHIGLYEKILNLLYANGMEVVEFSGVEPNPRHTTVNKGAAFCRQEKVDVILAVGGGSVIDCCKGIAATAVAATDDVWDFVEGKEMVQRALPLIAIPTIAASGSEVNAGGVISNLDKKIKRAVKSPLLCPYATFADPTNTFSVSPYQTACGSLDIMSHVFDSAYFSKQEQMDMILNMQETLFRTVIRYAPIAMREPDNYEARANLMWASMWVMNGFLDSGVRQANACHIMEHELSAYYDLNHGQGMAIILPKWLHYILDEITAIRIYRLGKECFGISADLGDIQGAEETIEALSDFCYDTLGLKSHLMDCDIGDEYFEKMAAHACENGPINSFKPLHKEDVVAIFRECL